VAITAPLVWLDGALVPVAQATLPLMGHAPQRGSLVFDVGSFHGAASGPSLFRAPEHVARFLRSAQLVGIAVPFDAAALLRASVEVVAACGGAEGLVRWSACFAAAESDLVPRRDAGRVAVAAQILEDPPRTVPIRVRTFDDARKASPDALPPDVKAAAAYLGPMMARRRAIAAGADDVVLLDRHGHLAEAPIANLFLVRGGHLHTPPLGHVLPGITRETVIALARDLGIPVHDDQPLPREALASAEEAFLCGTSLPVAPIGLVDGVSLPSAPGPVTTRIVERLHAAQRGGDPAHAAWSLRVDR